MRILLLNQFFWPDTAATAQLLHDLATALSQSGHTVSVICASGPYGETTGGPEPPAEIIRLNATPFSRGAGRLGSYLTFLPAALSAALRTHPPDVVVTLTTPPLLSLVGLALQRFRRARHVIWEMDVYPDVAIDLGVLSPRAIPARFFGWLADVPRHRADSILVLGDCMRDRLLAHGLPSEKLTVAHNWADGIPEPAPRCPCSGPLNILYSGNFGLAHDHATITDAILACSHTPTISFTFGGSGSRYAALKDLCELQRIPTVTFLPYCERPALAARLAASHIGLVTQKPECLGSAVPSKVYAIMAAARPVLFIGPRASTPALLIAQHNCGWQIDAGDSAALIRLLHHLNQNRHELTEAGNRAREAYQAHYHRDIGVSRIAAIVTGLKNV